MEQDRRNQEKIIEAMSLYPHLFKVKGNVLKSPAHYIPEYQDRLKLIQREIIIQNNKAAGYEVGKQRIKQTKSVAVIQKSRGPEVPNQLLPQLKSYNRNLSLNNIKEEEGSQELSIIFERQLQESSQRRNKKKKKKYIPLQFRDDADVEEERRILFQDNVQLNNGYFYLLEISFTKKKLLILAARKNKHYKLTFPKKQGKKLMQELNNDIESLIDLIKISKQKQLYIENVNRLIYNNYLYEHSPKVEQFSQDFEGNEEEENENSQVNTIEDREPKIKSERNSANNHHQQNFIERVQKHQLSPQTPFRSKEIPQLLENLNKKSQSSVQSIEKEKGQNFIIGNIKQKKSNRVVKFNNERLYLEDSYQSNQQQKQQVANVTNKKTQSILIQEEQNEEEIPKIPQI